MGLEEDAKPEVSKLNIEGGEISLIVDATALHVAIKCACTTPNETPKEGTIAQPRYALYLALDGVKGAMGQDDNYSVYCSGCKKPIGISKEDIDKLSGPSTAPYARSA